MNHCGRPECECYKKCCGECEHICRFATCVKKCDTPDCPCHTEKPVQEKPSFGTSGNDMGYPTAVFGDAPVQEMMDGFPMSKTNENPATPYAEGWAEEFDNQFYYHGDYVEEPREKIKSFITNLLAMEKEASVEFIAVHRDDWMAEGAKAERQRISEGVGKLKNDDDGKHPQIYDEPCEDCVENWMIERVLKVVRGEDIR